MNAPGHEYANAVARDLIHRAELLASDLQMIGDDMRRKLNDSNFLASVSPGLLAELEAAKAKLIAKAKEIVNS